MVKWRDAVQLPWKTPDFTTFAALVMAGILGGVSQLLVTESYRHADTSTVAPFEYTSMLFGIILGLTVFGDVPTVTMLVGATVVISASMLVIWREHQLRIERLPVSSWQWALIGIEDHDAA